MRKPHPHLLGSDPRIPSVQESQIDSSRAWSPEHMALLL